MSSEQRGIRCWSLCARAQILHARHDGAVLNIGLNDDSVVGTSDERFAGLHATSDPDISGGPGAGHRRRSPLDAKKAERGESAPTDVDARGGW